MKEKRCLVANCPNEPCNIRGWCVKHYQQWRRHGDPEWKDKKSPICSVENCQDKRLSRGMCNMHYQRWLKHGDPTVRLGTPPGIPPEERFWSKVQIKEKHECWPWIAGTDKDGYGIFGLEGTNALKAHRVAYQLHYGVQPTAWVLHRCDNPTCVNPRHLYLGTPMDNTQDKIVRGRARYAKGQETGNAKLTESQVLRIRHLHKQGLSFLELARLFNVTSGNISAIVHRETWKHI